MTSILILVAISLASVSATPPVARIASASTAPISSTSHAASLLYSRLGVGVYSQACGGSIITNKVILTSAYCLYEEPVIRWRVRVGSPSSTKGGIIHKALRSTVHPNYNVQTKDSDIGLLTVITPFTFNSDVWPATIAGANYNLPDHEAVYAIGWGLTSWGSLPSDELRQKVIWTISSLICGRRYSAIGLTITDNMVCAGRLDVDGYGQCIGDYGSPLVHRSNIVGIYSWGQGCGDGKYPSVNTFIPRFTNWIVDNV